MEHSGTFLNSFDNWLNQSLPVDKLADRQGEKNSFNRYLKEIEQRRTLSKQMLEWYGGPGIGKTQLVRILSEQCDNKNYPWIKIDFSQVDIKSYTEDPARLIENITAGLIRYFDLNDTLLQQSIETFRASPREIASKRVMIKAFLDIIRTVGEESHETRIRPFILFFDETEKIGTELAIWIEDYVIEQIIRQIDHCFVVWMGRYEHGWRSPNIQRKLESRKLSSFGREDVREQLEKLSAWPEAAQELAGGVYTLTQGHPFANSVVISLLDKWSEQSEYMTSNFLSLHKADLYKAIFDTFVLGYVLQEMEDELKIAFQYMAVLRYFDPEMMEIILIECAAMRFAGWDSDQFNDLSENMKKTQLLTFEKGKGYRVNPHLSYLIRNYYLTCDEQLFKQINQSALQIFSGWLNEPSIDNRNQIVAEEVYHLAMLKYAGEQVDLAKNLQQRLKQYEYWFEDKQTKFEELKTLRKILENKDEGLQGYLDDNNLISGLLEQLEREKKCYG